MRLTQLRDTKDRAQAVANFDLVVRALVKPAVIVPTLHTEKLLRSIPPALGGSVQIPTFGVHACMPPNTLGMTLIWGI
jgi:hypothetical protein